MAKNYGKKNVKRSGGGIGSLMFAFVAFVFGYLLATIFDIEHLSGWVNTHVFAQHKIPGAAPQVAQATAIPKPKFEFYTLLAKDQNGRDMPDTKVAVANPVPQPSTSVAPAMPSKVASIPAMPPADLNTTTQKLPLHAPLVAIEKDARPSLADAVSGQFMIQVASFKNRNEAEKMKASLVMKGFEARIVSAMQAQGQWHRVVIGPYTTRTQAQKAQLAFARSEHIVGMIRKTDA